MILRHRDTVIHAYLAILLLQPGWISSVHGPNGRPLAESDQSEPCQAHFWRAASISNAGISLSNDDDIIALQRRIDLLVSMIFRKKKITV